jgi:hypothetical protein
MDSAAAGIRERIGQVKADQKARGRYLGEKVPCGFRRGDDGELVPHEAEREAIREIVALGAQGKALRVVAGRDAGEGATKSATRAWRAIRATYPSMRSGGSGAGGNDMAHERSGRLFFLLSSSLRRHDDVEFSRDDGEILLAKKRASSHRSCSTNETSRRPALRRQHPREGSGSKRM